MSAPSHTRAAGQEGFTIIETMVASVLLLIGLVATLTMVEQAASTTKTTRTREQATSLQRELVEGARSVPFARLTVSTIGTQVRALPALGDTDVGATGWSIGRRGVTYKVAMTVCAVDDPRDGVGGHDAGVFCAATAPAPQDADGDGSLDGFTDPSATSCSASTCDRTPADYKRIVSLVTWPKGTNVQSSQVNNPGLSAAPAVTSLKVTTDALNNTVTRNDASLRLDATTDGQPEGVVFSVNGSAVGTGSRVGPDAWNRWWAFGAATLSDGAQPASKGVNGATYDELLDGSYELTAKAFDRAGQFGAPSSQIVKVNRRRHFAPLRIEAGRNGTAVEIEWSAAKEQDSLGFTVDRSLDGGAWTAVCTRKVQTSCRDLAPPAAATGQNLRYRVIGWDAAPDGSVLPGDATAVKQVVEAPAPSRPASLTAALLGDGTVELAWTLAAGDARADHYNIYRDGTAYADRLDAVYLAPEAALRYVDRRAAGVRHDYYITAVNDQLTESAPLGPVNR